MATLIIAPLTELIDEKGISELSAKLDTLNVELSPQTEELDQGVETELDEELLIEFLNDLEDEGAAADAYIPGDFASIITIDETQIASLDTLIDALESLQDSLGIDDYEPPCEDCEEEEIESDLDEEEDFLDQLEFSRKGLKSLWYDFYRIAVSAQESESNLIIKA